MDSEIDLTYLGGIERGKRNPSLVVLARIATGLRAELTDLVRNQRTMWHRAPQRSIAVGQITSYG